MYQNDQAGNESRRTAPIISRFTIVLLGAVLIGMGVGQQLHADLADLCGIIGLLGVASYVALDHVARNRDLEHATALQQAAESRLPGAVAAI